MNHESAQSRLCRLIDHSLRPFGEIVSVSSTPEVVKQLLISLSQVYRQIKLWTLEFDSASDDVRGTAEQPADGGGAAVCSDSHPDDHRCMAKIVGHLMSLLSLENPLILHLTGNTLVAIAEFAAATESGWAEYMHLLCGWLKFAIHNTMLASGGHELSRAKDFGIGSFIPGSLMKLRMGDGSYLTVASIIRVFRNVLKILKLNMDDKLLIGYLDSITDLFSKLPWDSLNEAYVVSNGEPPAGPAGHDLLCKNATHLKSVGIYHGNVVQLFCSLVDISGLSEAGAGSNMHPIVFQIRNLIPKILVGCFVGREHLDDVRIFHYLRHKILMLMMRLTSILHLERSDLMTWLHLIEKYFHDLLCQPLDMQESNLNDCLEGSPFWSDDYDAEGQKMSSSHLQRLAVFLFLRCSFILVRLNEKADKQFKVANSDSCFTFDLYSNSNYSSRSEGPLMLEQWLQRHLPSDTFVDHEMYSQRCSSFALAFLKLYMHEDDILFEMLLQLFHLPEKWFNRGGSLLTAKNDIFCLASDLFHPINFFHLFLAEIFYDHEVLLDYLISKDTGAKCAEYLLRCLRMVCNSWNLFAEFSTWVKPPNSSCRKRRRVLADGIDFEGNRCHASLEDDSVPSPMDTEGKHSGKHGRTKTVLVEDAKGCLLCLKASIDSLYQKNLFPYNPQVLLRRLSRFEELSLQDIQAPTPF
ncbi:uncharacterized protein [Coffea arabica]|uniref:Uncharacterized protein isoform X1 n=1 Tax=Coffea arabica TaxID=13443 RepID=A0ABM4V189_COFAR